MQRGGASKILLFSRYLHVHHTPNVAVAAVATAVIVF